MPTPAQNTQIRNATTGFMTTRASTATGNTPLAASATTIFTVTGGRILVISLVGQVTTVIQGQATTVQFISTPTGGGTAVNLSNATGDLNGKEVGATVTLATTLGGTAVVNNAGATVVAEPRFLVPPGAISVTMGAASTGALKYELIWVAYDAAATVTAGA